MNRLQANICLLCVTLCWSMEVVLYACIPEGIPTFATACVTSLAGAFLLFIAFHRRGLTALRSDGCRLILKTAFLAALSASYNTMYLCGIKSFDIASGAFTFCMTVVILPVVLLSFRRRIGLETLLSVVLVGLGIIFALGPSLRGEQLPGLALMGGGCLLRAVLIVVLADMAKRHDPLAIAILLELFTGVFALFGWLWQDPRLFFGLPLSRALVASWAIYSYFIEAIALSLNIIALKHVTATNATVVYSLEIVFSMVWGLILPASVITPVHLTPTVVLGAVLVLCGSLAEIIDIRGKRVQREAGK
ncbi:MAG: DMT family transporter [Victivallales bacterium]|nr:DMT family transporter [Victivallales bacterium]